MIEFSADKAPAYFQRHNLAEITLIYGNELLLNQEALINARKRAQHDGFLEKKNLDANKDAAWKTLPSLLDSPSLFTAHQLIELSFEGKKLSKTANDVLHEIAQRPLAAFLRLILFCPALEKPQSAAWYQALSKREFVVIQSVTFNERQFEQHLQQRFKNAQLRLDDAAFAYFCTMCAGNLLAAVQFIEQLRCIIHDNPVLDVATLQHYLNDCARLGSQEFRQALWQKQWQQAYRIAKRLEQEDPQQIMLLTWFLERDSSILLQLKSGKNPDDVFRDYRLYRRQQMLYRQAEKLFTLKELLSFLTLAGQLDQMNKGAIKGSAWQRLIEYLLLIMLHQTSV